MSAMKNYFDFSCMTMCGISRVRLLGHMDDWLQLKKSIIGLNEYGLEWWTASLVEIIQKIIDSLNGEVDAKFWKYIFKFYPARGSGQVSRVNGWIMNFFPYFHK